MTKRDIQLVVDGGFNTVESVAYTPRRMLEQIKGISEQKAAKILGEGMQSTRLRIPGIAKCSSIQTRSYGLHDRNGDAPTAE